VAPVIDAGGTYSATVGEAITFTVAITDVPADSHLVAWDLDDNGTYETSGQSVTRTYASAGTYQVRVRVTDDDGGAATDVAQVVISGYTVYLPAIAYNANGTPGRLPPD
jgi:PKD repeat protein